VVFHNKYNGEGACRQGRSGFTMVEVVVAIALIGIGLSTTIGALTKFNAFASESRNATGAYAAAMNQIDAIQSATPFTPPTQIPSVLTVGTQAPEVIKIYQDANNNTIVSGTRTTTVADVSAGGATIYRATVTVNYTYLGQSYSYSMQTLRASD
jgi:prepilin-type N-terminal cleavage/methylation domain-containing protein